MSEVRMIADAPARARALDVQTSFIVQAPAGSGKTELLSQRYLTLLAHADAPEEVVAITFTRKAAAEMRNRILEALDRAGNADYVPGSEHEKLTRSLAQAVLARDRERGWRLVSHPTRLRIQTIDSLCSALTRQMPLLSRFGNQPGIEDNVGELYRRAARATLAEVEQGESWSPAIEELLRHLDNNLAVAESLLAGMLARRDQWLRHVADRTSGRLRREELEAGLQRVVTDTLADAAAHVPGQYAGELTAVAAWAGANLAEQDGDSALRACAELTSLPGGDLEALPAWQGLVELLLTRGEPPSWRKSLTVKQGFPAPSGARDKAAKAERKENKERAVALIAALGEVPGLLERLQHIAQLPPPAYTDRQWAVLAALVELLPLAVAQLRLVFAEQGRVDFTEVSQAALVALGEPGEPTDLALALDYRIQHLLVDEFQDTSLSQFELLERLTAGWQPGDGRTLFVVGDPMQSIYRFREAEVGLYLRARTRGIGYIPLEPLSLRVNFRSQRGIVDWVNASFARVLAAEDDIASGAVGYTPSEAVHSAGSQEAVRVHPVLGRQPAGEAARVLELIEQTRANDPEASIAVLVRSRGHLVELLPLLKAARIRYRALEIEQLGHRPVVQDLLALTRALVHPADRVAWLSVLRAPWCGLTLADLHALCGAEPARGVWTLMNDPARAAAMSRDGQARLQRVVSVLGPALAQRGRVGLRRFVEGAWLGLGGPACGDGRTDLEDALVYLALLERFDDGGALVDFAGLAEAVSSLFALPDVDADERLQIMTIHKAKGLEFDTVIVPGLGRTPRGEDPRLLLWSERARSDDDADLLLAPIKSSAEAKGDPIYRYLKRLEQVRQRHEDGRLLYVAATRARRRLHLLGHVDYRETDDGPSLGIPASTSLLRRLWPVVGAEFEAALADLQVASAELAAAAAPRAVLRRVGADWQPPAPGEDVRWRAAPLSAREAQTEAIEFDWAGETARHVGTVVHRYLQTIARDGAAQWDETRVRALAPALEVALRRLGVPGEECPGAVGRAVQALAGALADPRGRWVLDAGHAQARSEYALSGVLGGTLINVVMDRTFVDGDGVRWVVDYKTSVHSGGDLEGFLDREQERYRAQLERYAHLLARLEDCPIRMGLYFPLLRGWREWSI
ncbi:MAG TPA: UvrD-helicase domain-containing protein [Gammaproteobacteria bacterium]|nr:UvrD-helicase domain-containing protein [Gammaproteobacteria bacterium]